MHSHQCCENATVKANLFILQSGGTLPIFNAWVWAGRLSWGLALRFLWPKNDFISQLVSRLLCIFCWEIVSRQGNRDHHNGLLLCQCIWIGLFPRYRYWRGQGGHSRAWGVWRMVSFQTGLTGLAWLLAWRLKEEREVFFKPLMVTPVLLVQMLMDANHQASNQQ